MVRNNRQVTRLFFILVLAMVLLGAWVGSILWQPNLDALSTLNITGEGDWIDLVASLGEVVLQLFLGVTS